MWLTSNQKNEHKTDVQSTERGEDPDDFLQLQFSNKINWKLNKRRDL